jgi:hypothetical protein
LRFETPMPRFDDIETPTRQSPLYHLFTCILRKGFMRSKINYVL